MIDEIVKVKDEDAFAISRKLARLEGVLCGISTGAAVCGALEIAEKLGRGKTVVTISPDTGERYLSIRRAGAEYATGGFSLRQKWSPQNHCIVSEFY